jgi:hypothetical protein
MTILLAGYGGIGRAVQALLRKHALFSTDVDLHIADPRHNGLTAEAWLAAHPRTAHTLINVSTASTRHMVALADQYGLHYIDTGIAFDSGESGQLTYDQAFRALKAQPTDRVRLIGFGMNPGLIEFIHAMRAPAGLHTALELEYDTATWNQSGLFNTWSPATYYEETVSLNSECYIAGQPRHWPQPGIAFGVALTPQPDDGISFDFNVIPHEEVGMMSDATPQCQACAFLYSAPQRVREAFRRHYHAHGASLTAADLAAIAVPGEGLSGHDTIGMLYAGLDETPLDYYYNSASHRACALAYQDGTGRGINATSWQVACGVVVALRLLAKLSPGSYGVSDVAVPCRSEIVETLALLGFDIQHRILDRTAFGWERVEALLQTSQPSPVSAAAHPAGAGLLSGALNAGQL